MVRFSAVRMLSFLAVGSLLSFTAPLHAQSNINLRLMPLGDSITAGYDSTTGNGWRGPLATALTGKVAVLDFVGSQNDGTMADPDNEGHYGDTISEIADLATTNLNTYKPNLVLLDVGINDLASGTESSSEVADAPTRLASLIDQILSAEPDATVLVAQLIVNQTSDAVEDDVVAFNNALPAIVQARANEGEHVYLVDMSAVTTADLDGNTHPNDTGYQVMANAWYAAIQQVIANGWITDPVAGSATRPNGAIYSGISGKCLENENVSGTTTYNAVLDDCNGGATQQWNLNSGDIIMNNMCLDIFGGGTSSGTPVDVFSCNDQTNQVWLVQNGTLYNPTSNMCLTDPGSTTTDGTQLQIAPCTGAANQQWRVPSEGAVVSGVSGFCLDSFGGFSTSGNKVDIYGCNSTAAQQWQVTNNTLTFDGKCLNVVGSGTLAGTLVDVETCTNAANQVWTPVNGTLVNPASGRCLDDPGASTTAGTQLDIANCSNAANQQWTLPPM